MNIIGKYIFGMAVVTMFLLIYVHQQIAIIQCSYRINDYECEIVALSEFNKNFKYKLASLKSPALAEQKLTAAEINLVLPESVRVIHIPILPQPSIQLVQADVSPHSFSLMNILGFENEAQADLAH